MGSGQQIASLYVSLDVELKQLQDKLRNGASVVEDFIDKINKQKLTIGDDKELLKGIERLEEFGNKVRDVFDLSAKATRQYFDAIKGVSDRTKVATTVFGEWGTALADVTAKSQAAEASLNKAVNLGEYTGFKDAQINAGKRTLEILVGVREAVNSVTGAFVNLSGKNVRLDSILRLPGGDKLLVPLEALTSFINGELTEALNQVKGIGIDLNKGVKVAPETFGRVNADLLKVQGRAEAVKRVYTEMNKVSRASSSVLAVVGERWADISNSANKTTFKTLKKDLLDVAHILNELGSTGFTKSTAEDIDSLTSKLKTAQERIKNTIGVPIQEMFANIGTSMGQVTAVLQDFGITKGLADLEKAHTLTEGLTDQAVRFDEVANQIDLKKLAASSKDAKSIIDGIREGFQGAIGPAKEIEVVAVDLVGALNSAKEVAGKTIIGTALQGDRAELKNLINELKVLEKTSEVERRSILASLGGEGELQSTRIQIQGVETDLASFSERLKKMASDAAGSKTSIIDFAKFEDIRKAELALKEFGIKLDTTKVSALGLQETLPVFDNMRIKLKSFVKELSAVSKEKGAKTKIGDYFTTKEIDKLIERVGTYNIKINAAKLKNQDYVKSADDFKLIRQSIGEMGDDLEALSKKSKGTALSQYFKDFKISLPQITKKLKEYGITLDAASLKNMKFGQGAKYFKKLYKELEVLEVKTSQIDKSLTMEDFFKKSSISVEKIAYELKKYGIEIDAAKLKTLGFSEGVDKFKAILKVVNTLQSKMSKLADTTAKPATIQDMFSPTEIQDMVKELGFLGIKIDEAKLKTTDLGTASEQFTKMQQKIHGTVNALPELLNLLRLLGKEEFDQLLMSDADLSDISVRLEKVSNLYSQFLRKIKSQTDQSGQKIKGGFIDSVETAFNKLQNKDISLEAFESSITGAVTKIRSPIEGVVKDLTSMVATLQKVQKDSGLKTQGKAAAQFEQSILAVRQQFLSLLALMDSTDSPMALLDAFAEFGVGEEQITHIKQLVDTLKGISSGVTSWEEFQALLASNQGKEAMQALGLAADKVKKSTKAAAQEGQEAMQQFASRIAATLNSLKGTYSEMAGLLKISRFTEADYDKFSDATDQVEKYTASIRDNTQKWEAYRQEIRAVKSMGTDTFIKHIAEEAEQASPGLDKVNAKVKEMSQLMNIKGGTKYAAQFQKEYIASLQKMAAAAKGNVTKEYELYYANAQKLIHLSKVTASAREENMRKQLERLVAEQDKYGVSIGNLRQQLELWNSLQQETGGLLPQESAKVAQLTNMINGLGIEYAKTAEIQKKLRSESAVPEQLGHFYDAMTKRLKQYKDSLTDVIQKTADYLRSSYSMTDSEAAYQKTFDESSKKLDERKTAIDKLREAEKLIGSRKSIKMTDDQGKVTDEYRTLRQVMKELNIEVTALGQNRVRLNIKDLDSVKSKIGQVRRSIEKEMKGIVDDISQDFGKFKVDYDTEAAVQQLKELGKAELQAADNKQVHADRVAALEKAFKAEKFPREQLLQFLKDEKVIQQQHLETMQAEHKVRGRGITGLIEEQRAKVAIAKTNELYRKTLAATTEGTKEYVDAQKDAEKYMRQTADQAKEATGRYRGVQKALQSIVSDMKNLIQVQIRWYATQSLIFKSLQAVQELFTFYQDLEVQVSRVTSALTSQGSIMRTNSQVLSVLRREMIRTGKSAEELATILWELVSAGLSHQEAMAGVAHITNLAVAAELELSETTRITAGIYRVFGEQLDVVGSSADKWQYIADRLSATLNQSQVDMQGLVAGLGYLINEADAAGLEFEQVLGVLSVLNNRLLLGSKAGRSASRVLTQLTSNAKELSKAFGIEMDFSGPLDLMELLTKLNVVLKANTVNGKLTVETFDKLQDIFGQVGKRAAVGLITNLEELQDTVGRLKSDEFVGLTEVMAGVKLDPISVQLTKFTNALKIFGTVIIGPVIGAFKMFIGAVNEVVEALAELPEGVQNILSLTTAVIGLGAAASGLVRILNALGLAFAQAGLLTYLGTMTVKILAFSKAMSVVPEIWGNVNGVWRNSTVVVGAATNGVARYSKALTFLAGHYKLVGAAVIAVIGGLSWMVIKYRDARNAVYRLSDELEEAKTKHYEAIQTIGQESDKLESLATKYKNAVPYTREWLEVREQINLAYPTLLSSMEAELAVTGEITETLDKLVRLKHDEHKVNQLLEDYDKKSIEFRESARDKTTELIAVLNKASQRRAEKVDAVGDSPFPAFAGGPVTGLTDPKFIKEELQKSLTVIAKWAIEVKRITGVVPEEFKKLGLSILDLRSPVDSIFTAVEALKTLKTEGGKITEDFILLLNELPPDIQQAIDELVGVDIEFQGTLNTTQIEQVLTLLNTKIDTVVSTAGFKSIGDRYEEFLKQVNRDTEQQLSPEEWTTYFESVKTGAEDVYKSLPLTFQKVLTDFNATTTQIMSTFEEANRERIELAKRDHGVQIQLIKELNQELTQGSTQAAELATLAYTGLIRRITSLLGGLQTASGEEWEDIRKRIKTEMALMGADARAEIEKQLTPDQKRLFGIFLGGATMEEMAASRDQLVDIFKTIVLSLGEMSNAAKTFMRSQLSDTDNLLEATNLFGNAMRDVARNYQPLVNKYLQENQSTIAEALSYLPGYARQVLAQATTLEQVELIKMVKETREKIRQAISEAPTKLTPEMQDQIRLRHYAEMYDKIKIYAKEAFDEQVRLEKQLTAMAEQTTKGIADISLSNFQREKYIIDQRIELERKYQKIKETIAKDTKTATVLGFDAKTILPDYRELENEITKLDKRYGELDKRIAGLKETLRFTDEGIAFVLSETADTAEITGKIDMSTQNVFGDKIEVLQDYLQATNIEIKDKFTEMLPKLNENQREFFKFIVKTVEKNQNLSEEGSRVWLQQIIDAAIRSKSDTFEQVADKVVNLMSKQLNLDSLERARLITELQKAQGDADELFLKGLKEGYTESKQLQQIKLQESKVRVFELIENLNVEYTAYQAHYARIKEVQNRDLQDLKNYIKTYSKILDPQTFSGLLSEVVEAQVTQYKTLREERQKDLNFARRMFNLQRDLNKIKQEQLEIAPLDYSDTEANDIAAAEKRIELAKKLLDHQNQELNKLKLSQQYSSPAINQINAVEMANLEADIKAQLKILEEAEQEKIAINAAAQTRRTKEQEALAKLSDQELERLKQTQAQIAQALETLAIQQVLGLASFAESTFKDLNDNISQAFERQSLDILAAFTSGDLNYEATMDEWKQSMYPAIYKAREDLTYAFADAISTAMKNANGKVDIGKEAVRFQKILNDAYVDTIIETTRKMREELTKGMDAVNEVLASGQNISPQAINLEVLGRLGVNIQSLKQSNQELGGIYADNRKELTKSLNVLIEMYEWRVKHFQSSLDNYRLASKEYEVYRNSLLGIQKGEEKTGANRAKIEEAEGVLAILQQQATIQAELNKGDVDEKKAAQLTSTLGAIDTELAKHQDVVNLLTSQKGTYEDINRLFEARRTAQIESEAAEADIANNAKAVEKAAQAAVDHIRQFGNPWQKFTLGLREATDELYKAATDWEQIAIGMVNTINDALATAFADTIDELALMLSGNDTEEEVGLQEDLWGKQQDIAEIQRKIDDLALGGIDYSEAGELETLKKSLAEAQKEAKKFNAELQEAGDHSKRLAEIWKEVGKAIVKELITIATKMLAIVIIQMIFKGLSSLGGSSGGSSGIDVGSLMKTGGFSLTGFSGFDLSAKGGVKEGGYTQMRSVSPSTAKEIQRLFDAKFFSSGGIADGPVLGMVGEGGQSEAVVPLPDNRSIPVRFEGGGGKSDVKIMNIVDPSLVPTVLLENPETVINIVAGDIQKRGVLYQSFKSLQEKK